MTDGNKQRKVLIATLLASFPGSPLHVHVYCVTFDPHVWVKGHAIDVCM